MARDWLGRCVNCGHYKEQHNIPMTIKSCLEDCPCSEWREEC
jgi:hypothetical protein